MTVYVENMRAAHRRLILCHMVGDTEDELHAMADRIGVARHHHQGDHYDVCLAKRALAVAAGAVEITQRQRAAMVARRRIAGALGHPKDAVAWLRVRLRSGRLNPGGISDAMVESAQQNGPFSIS